ncbi:MAG: iron ABC transporter permease, partial [Deltaproteobacteria bacterium]|nr:iron ABC transporter permease [Deltaproteobacteria bacterium]
VAFFFLFLLYPLSYVFSNAFYTSEGFSLIFFKLMMSSPNYREVLVNSVNLGLAVTLITTLVSLPLALLLVRYDFRGKGLLSGLILIPMVLPPFVGA